MGGFIINFLGLVVEALTQPGQFELYLQRIGLIIYLYYKIASILLLSDFLYQSGLWGFYTERINWSRKMIQSRKTAHYTFAITLSWMAGIAANADEVSFDFAQTNGTQSASANFTFADGAELGDLSTLTITMTNNMTTNSGPQWLTGLFFDVAGSPALDYQSVDGEMITLDGTTQHAYTDPAPDHFWAYRDDLTGELPFGDQEYGLGAAGFDIFGESDILNFDPKGPKPQPDGTDGGILADIAGLAVPDGHSDTPFVLGSLQLTFWLPEGFDLDAAGISNIAFVFGTGFDEIVLIPLPIPLVMAATGFGIVAVFRRKLTALAGV